MTKQSESTSLCVVRYVSQALRAGAKRALAAPVLAPAATSAWTISKCPMIADTNSGVHMYCRADIRQA